MTMHPMLKIAIAAAAATYVTPAIVNRFTVPELNSRDETRNTAMALGVTGSVTAAVFVVLSMAFGGEKATTAGGGGAS